MMLYVRLCLALALTALLAVPALAKGPIDKITVEGPGLGAPIEITSDAEMLKFNPGSREFIAWELGIVPPPPATAQTYSVSFYLESEKIYVLEYTPDPSGGPGFIYVPGPEHPAYWRNVAFVLSNSTDPWNPNGQWQHATAEWEAMVEAALQARGATQAALGPSRADALATPGQAPLATVPGPWPSAISVTAVGLAAGLALVAWRSRRQESG
jgi:hypothetical protein